LAQRRNSSDESWPRAKFLGEGAGFKEDLAKIMREEMAKRRSLPGKRRRTLVLEPLIIHSCILQCPIQLFNL